eukprot:TRINITY_DN6275_c0_g2_i8.p1 TRINITY_DN6275_c0_g2~~TRINITY_DN6275_c0_g2_i8.p1  ORF type:complete len:115 (-),score=27.42 TRINITY_DN6275_c0_g2_i8:228-572(-)
MTREFSLHSLMRVWDTYISEGEGYATLHTYLCAALLVHFEKQIRSLESQELMTFIQNFPTNSWSVGNVEMLLAQAYVFKQQFNESPSHLTSFSAQKANTQVVKIEAISSSGPVL